MCMIMAIIVTLLTREYYQYAERNKDLLLLQEQYYIYADMLKKKLAEPIDTECLKKTVSHQSDTHTNSLDTNQNYQPKYGGDVTLHESLPHAIAKTKKRYGHKPYHDTSYGASNKKGNIKKEGLFQWPLDQNMFWLSSKFGPRKKKNGSWGFHYGIDMAAMKGTPVKAAADGIVEESQEVSGYGNTIVINHQNGYKTRYAHLESRSVAVRKHVTAGEVIATVGDTGFTIKSGKYATHLHFEVYEKGKHVNPLYYLVS